MSDQILTEEELKDFVKEVIILKGLKIKSSMDLIKSHRHLLSANAELSFKNMKLKEALSKVKDHLEGVMNPRRFVILDGPGMLQTLIQALEELK